MNNQGLELRGRPTLFELSDFHRLDDSSPVSDSDLALMVWWSKEVIKDTVCACVSQYSQRMDPKQSLLPLCRTRESKSAETGQFRRQTHTDLEALGEPGIMLSPRRDQAPLHRLQDVSWSNASNDDAIRTRSTIEPGDDVG